MGFITGKQLSFICSILFSFAVATSLELRNPGDVLWSQCKNITYNGISLPNSCIVLSEEEDCGLNVALSVSGSSIFSQSMDLSAVPSVCGSYSGCDICVSIVPNPTNNNSRCVQIVPRCPIYSPPAQTIGCFASSVLADVIACELNKCPNDCSGHGTCSQGVCTCDDGWNGNDCNTTGALFESCQRVDTLSADICVRLDFDECNITTQIVIEGNGQELSVFDEEYPVRDFQTVFQEQQCVSIGVCQACLSWASLILTEVEASGCASLDMDCLGYPYQYTLGCFHDDKVVPKCFGTCPNNCSYNGYCDKGLCKCVDNWGGADCSVRKYPPCQPADCNGHGVCVMGECRCNEHWGNADCNTYMSGTSSNTQPKKVGLMVILVPVFLIVAIIVAAIIIWLVKRRSQQQTGAKFHQLELINEDEDDHLVDIENTEEK